MCIRDRLTPARQEDLRNALADLEGITVEIGPGQDSPERHANRIEQEEISGIKNRQGPPIHDAGPAVEHFRKELERIIRESAPNKNDPQSEP
jgi:hypothetical protein